MNSFLRKKWQALHVSKDYFRISRTYRLNKKNFKIVDISNRRPNLIILGSQKCGTTSLYFYLNHHPEIAVSSPLKEPGYFLFDGWAQDYWKRKNLFINSKEELILDHMSDQVTEQKYFCDASTYYTQDTNELKYNIPEIIASISPDAKFIYIIRNPFERLRSVYYHLKRGGINTTIDGMLNDWIINTTLYYDRIEPYISKFGQENIHIIQMKELVHNPKETLDVIFCFLNIVPVSILEFKTHNKTTPDTKEKFSEESFYKLKPLFDKQKKLLEINLGLHLDWDLDYETWVESKQTEN